MAIVYDIVPGEGCRRLKHLTGHVSLEDAVAVLERACGRRLYVYRIGDNGIAAMVYTSKVACDTDPTGRRPLATVVVWDEDVTLEN